MRTPVHLRINTKMQEEQHSVAVIGVGIIGLCTALNLQRSGHSVTVIDALEPGASASYGNSGMLSADSTIPMALPGMLRNVPKWLRDPLGPLHVDPGYLPKVTPWLIRWMLAGRMKTARKASFALAQLHRNTLPAYRTLLGADAYADLVREVGNIQLWDTAQPSLSERISEELRKEQGITTVALSVDELQDLVPGITKNVTRALFFPNNANAVNPQRLAMTIARFFSEAGGTHLHEKVYSVFPDAMGLRIVTNCSDLRFSKVVIATGAWSHQLLGPLGHRVPLETERGYHMQLESDSVGLKIPILFRSRGFSASPMEMGLRLSGTVEFAGLDRPPRPARAEVLLKQGKALFPDLRFRDCKMWMGFRPSLPDSVPIIDQSPKHPGLFLAFGHGHTGLTAGAVTGELITRMVNGQPPMFDMTPYSVKR